MTRRARFSALRKARSAFRANCCPETLDALLAANAALSWRERQSYRNEEMWREYRAARVSLTLELFP